MGEDGVQIHEYAGPPELEDDAAHETEWDGDPVWDGADERNAVYEFRSSQPSHAESNTESDDDSNFVKRDFVEDGEYQSASR